MTRAMMTTNNDGETKNENKNDNDVENEKRGRVDENDGDIYTRYTEIPGVYFHHFYLPAQIIGDFTLGELWGIYIYLVYIFIITLLSS